MPKLDHLDLEARVAEILHRRPAVGLAVGVVRDGALTFFSGNGFTDIRSRTPVTEDTVFRVGSLTKTFTAIAVVQQVEAGTMGLDDDIRSWVPEFSEKPWPVTVRQLLGHLGGVSHYRDPAAENRQTKRLTTVPVPSNSAIGRSPSW